MWQNSTFLLTDVPGLKREGSTLVKMPAWTDSSEEDTAAPAKKGRRRNRKCKGKAVLAVEGSDDTGSTKKTKAGDPDKEMAGCFPCRPLVAAEKPGNSDKRYCKIHRTKGHALQDCQQ